MSAPIPGEGTLRAIMEPMLVHLERPGVTEVQLNEPGWLWVQKDGVLLPYEAANLTFDRLISFAHLAAAMTKQDVNETMPLVRTVLPGGYRCQIAVPPIAPHGTILFSIRVASDFEPDLPRLREGGMFDSVRVICPKDLHGLSDVDADLVNLLAEHRIEEFLRLCVLAKKNVGITGSVGTGKTTIMRAMGAAIPHHERVATIEDTRELRLKLPNVAAMSYSKGEQSSSKVGANELLEACLSMGAHRVLMGEIRDGAAFTYIRNAAAGFPGSLATWHAKSARHARKALALMYRQHPASGAMTDATVLGLLSDFVDVIVHCERDGSRYAVAEILFEPEPV